MPGHSTASDNIAVPGMEETWAAAVCQMLRCAMQLCGAAKRPVVGPQRLCKGRHCVRPLGAQGRGDPALVLHGGHHRSPLFGLGASVCPSLVLFLPVSWSRPLVLIAPSRIGRRAGAAFSCACFLTARPYSPPFSEASRQGSQADHCPLRDIPPSSLRRQPRSLPYSVARG